MEQPHIGFVKVETIVIGDVPDDRLVRWQSPPGRAAGLADSIAPELLEAWQVVARDLETPDALVPLVFPDDWAGENYASAGVRWKDGGGTGISVPRHEPLAERVVYLADQFQQSEVEALWFAGRSAVWPHCPRHPNTHPLYPRLHNGVAVWICGESDVIAPIGGLFAR
jgi:hypothetical protein